MMNQDCVWTIFPAIQAWEVSKQGQLSAFDTCAELEIPCERGYIHTQSLIFENKKHLLNTLFWGMKPPSDVMQYPVTPINTFGLHVRFVDETVGFGLFSTTTLPSSSFVGEYTGVVRSSSTLNGYSMDYYSLGMEEDLQIDASEYGSLMRFLNHSDDPNCEFVHVWHRGLFHVMVRSLRPILADEQLLVSYGPSYWRRHPSPPVNFPNRTRDSN